MDWITDNIAIGNYLDAMKSASEVDTILCLKPGCCDEDRTDVEIFCIPLKDGAGNRKKDIENAVELSQGLLNPEILSWSTAMRAGRGQ